MIVFHQASRLADCGADIDEDRRRRCFEDGGEIWAGHFLAEVREILEHLLWL